MVNSHILEAASTELVRAGQGVLTGVDLVAETLGRNNRTAAKLFLSAADGPKAPIIVPPDAVASPAIVSHEKIGPILTRPTIERFATDMYTQTRAWRDLTREHVTTEFNTGNLAMAWEGSFGRVSGIPFKDAGDTQKVRAALAGHPGAIPAYEEFRTLYDHNAHIQSLLQNAVDQRAGEIGSVWNRMGKQVGLPEVSLTAPADFQHSAGYTDGTFVFSHPLLVAGGRFVPPEVAHEGAHLEGQYHLTGYHADLMNIGKKADTPDQLKSLADLVSISPETADRFLALRAGRSLDQSVADQMARFVQTKPEMYDIKAIDEIQERLQNGKALHGLSFLNPDFGVRTVTNILHPETGRQMVKELYGTAATEDQYARLQQRYQGLFPTGVLRPSDEARALGYVREDLQAAVDATKREKAAWEANYEASPFETRPRIYSQWVKDHLAKEFGVVYGK